MNKETLHRVNFLTDLLHSQSALHSSSTLHSQSTLHSSKTIKFRNSKFRIKLLLLFHEMFSQNNFKIDFEYTNSLPFGKLLDETSFDPKILKEIKKSKSFIKATLHLDFSLITIFYCFQEDKIKDDFVKLERITQRIGVLYTFLKQFMRFKFPNELFVYFYFTHLKKMLPSKRGKVLGYYEVNTGVTIARGNEIAVYRQEEYFKVLIHESFHTLGLDFAVMDIKLQNKLLKDIFKVNEDILLSESYAEFYATILNLMFLTYEKNFRRFKSNFLYLLEKEKHFKVFQMVKMLNHMSMRYTDFFQDNQFKENTNVFAYYVLCGILLFFAEEFLLFCEINNLHSILQAEETDVYIEKMVLFVKQYCRDDRFLKVVEMTERSLHHLKNKTHKKKKTYLTSLRMTLSEGAI